MRRSARTVRNSELSAAPEAQALVFAWLLAPLESVECGGRSRALCGGRHLALPREAGGRGGFFHVAQVHAEMLGSSPLQGAFGVGHSVALHLQPVADLVVPRVGCWPSHIVWAFRPLSAWPAASSRLRGTLCCGGDVVSRIELTTAPEYTVQFLQFWRQCPPSAWTISELRRRQRHTFALWPAHSEQKGGLETP